MFRIGTRFWFAAAVGVLTLLTAVGYVVAQGVDLHFVVWSYSIETIQDNIKQFEEANPGVTVELTDFGWNDYHDVMATRFASNTPTEVAYSSDHWLQEWVAAGWAAPLDDNCPSLMDSVKDF